MNKSNNKILKNRNNKILKNLFSDFEITLEHPLKMNLDGRSYFYGMAQSRRRGKNKTFFVLNCISQTKNWFVPTYTNKRYKFNAKSTSASTKVFF